MQFIVDMFCIDGGGLTILTNIIFCIWLKPWKNSLSTLIDYFQGRIKHTPTIHSLPAITHPFPPGCREFGTKGSMMKSDILLNNTQLSPAQCGRFFLFQSRVVTFYWSVHSEVFLTISLFMMLLNLRLWPWVYRSACLVLLLLLLVHIQYVFLSVFLTILSRYIHQ